MNVFFDEKGMLVFEHGRAECSPLLTIGSTTRLLLTVRTLNGRVLPDYASLERKEVRTLAQVLLHFADTGELRTPLEIEQKKTSVDPPREDVFLAEDGLTRLGPVLYAQRQGEPGYDTVSAKEALHFRRVAEAAQKLAEFCAEHARFETGETILGLDRGEVRGRRLLFLLGLTLADAGVIERPEWMQEDAP